MDDLFTHVEDPETYLPEREIVQYAFDNLKSDDALCRWMVGVQCLWGNWDDTDASVWPMSFLTSVLEMYARLMLYDGNKNDGLFICDYHDCEESENCPEPCSDS